MAKRYKAQIHAHLPAPAEKDGVFRSINELMGMLNLAIQVDCAMNNIEVVMTLFQVSPSMDKVHIEYTKRDGTDAGKPYISVDATRIEVEGVDEPAPKAETRTPEQADTLPSDADIPDSTKEIYAAMLAKAKRPTDPSKLN